MSSFRKDGKYAALQREIARRSVRGELRASSLGLESVSHEIPCLFSIPHLVITATASTVRKLSALQCRAGRFMEDRVCRFLRTRLPRGWVDEGKMKGRMVR